MAQTKIAVSGMASKNDADKLVAATDSVTGVNL